MSCALPRNSAAEWLGTVKKTESQMPMNIYVTSASPQTCARNLDNAMLEDQILTVAVLMSAYAKSCSYRLNDLWKCVHSNHPFLRWMLNDEANVDWLKEYGVMLIIEYGTRHMNQHAGANCIYSFIQDFESPVGLEPKAFLNRAWDETHDFRFEPNVYTAYRWFLSARWALAKRRVTWGNRMPPAFFVEHQIARGGNSIVLEHIGEDKNGVIIN